MAPGEKKERTKKKYKKEVMRNGGLESRKLGRGFGWHI